MNDSTGKPIGETLLGAIAQFRPQWAQDTHTWREALSELIEYDKAVLAVLNPEHPMPDGFLFADGVDSAELQQWCRSDVAADPLMQQTLCQGTCTDHHNAGLLTGHCLASTVLGCHERGTRWWFAVAREDRPYNDQERPIVAAFLRMLAAKFDVPDESGLGLVLMNHELEMIHADPVTCLRLTQHPDLIKQLASNLRSITEQRWKLIEDHQTHSVFIPMEGDRPLWVRFRRGSADHAEHAHWYLELRPLEEADPPPVGLVEDRRVAEAMGYLTDHFKQAPVLGDVAAHVNTSPFHFHRLFSKQAGISPKHFLLRTQLMHAKQMLRATRMPIGDIARESGFASHGHFTATFNRIIGLSPSEYREKA